ncbi:hypothetical protein M0R45_022436 [Rubus argutus]|uniref:STAS domain-containing protein n=1 Tax=Rubus argutus TaxID=59490 RepID=A0AAW1XGE7_RUBAR
MTAVSTIDTTGITLFGDLRKAITKRGLELVLVNPLAEVMEKLQKADESKAAAAAGEKPNVIDSSQSE